MSETHDTGLATLQPPGWPRPKGYANGMVGRGRLVVLAGQIGWDAQGAFAEGFAAQTGQALSNILAVLAGAHRPADLVRHRHRRLSRPGRGTRAGVAGGDGAAFPGDVGGRRHRPGGAGGPGGDRGDRDPAGLRVAPGTGFSRRAAHALMAMARAGSGARRT